MFPNIDAERARLGMSKIRFGSGIRSFIQHNQILDER